MECRNICQNTEERERHMESLIISQVFLKYYRYLKLKSYSKVRMILTYDFLFMVCYHLTWVLESTRSERDIMICDMLNLRWNAIAFFYLIISLSHSKHDITIENIMLALIVFCINFMDMFSETFFPCKWLMKEPYIE